jgi:hypothetical protein
MKRAGSGRPADLAALAIAQETYEAATVDWEQWESGERVAIAIDPVKTRDVGAIVEQELAWRKVHQHEKPASFLRRLGRRFRGS